MGSCTINNKMKKYLNKKNLLILGVIVIILFIFFGSSLTPKRPSVTTPIAPIIPIPTTTIPELDINQTENTPEWNKIFDEAQQKYENSLNKKAEESLSSIRQNSPIDVSGNIIVYEYKNATYTIRIITPYIDNQNIVLDWLKEKGIDQNVIKNLRINWVQK